ncbi:PcfJ domain-containing protein [Agrobacterium salinitolerans]|nr:PcfJ domain-containing protein [Agrobacterium salinitolerans]
MNLEAVTKEVHTWLASFVETLRRHPADDVDILPSLNISLGRVLVNMAMKVKSFHPVNEEVSADEIRHICDWLHAAHLRREAWLSRCDDQGRPLKLMKFGTVAQMTDEANKAMAKRRGDGATASALQGVKAVYDAGDGWSIVRLTTPEALDHEGHVMGHCVGQGAYDMGLSTNFTGIYSLRDPFGKSHATLEIDHSMDTVRQIKGKQNKPPIPEYMRRLLGWRVLMEASVDRSELPPGFGARKSGGIVDFASLKPGDVFDGNIAIVLADNDDYVLDIPAGVTVLGDVVIAGHKAGRLIEHGNIIQMHYPKVTVPDGVVFEGDVRVDHVTLDGFSISARRLVIRNATVLKLDDIRCDVTQFAGTNFSPTSLEGASFKGSVEMQACRGVVFQASTEIGAQVSVAGCKPSQAGHEVSVEFADGFKARRRLHIYNSAASFGDECHVDGSVDIKESLIVRMPLHLSATGYLNVENTHIDRWPETLDVKGNVIEKGVETGLSLVPPPLTRGISRG